MGTLCEKKNLDGIVSWYKTQLVSKGFHQQPKIDYFETLIFIVKPATVRALMCLTISNNVPLRQMDVNNSFLLR